MSLDTWHNMLQVFEKMYDDLVWPIYLPSSVKKSKGLLQKPRKVHFFKKKKENKVELGKPLLVSLIFFISEFICLSQDYFKQVTITNVCTPPLSQTCIRGAEFLIQIVLILYCLPFVIRLIKMELYALKRC